MHVCLFRCISAYFQRLDASYPEVVCIPWQVIRILAWPILCFTIPCVSGSLWCILFGCITFVRVNTWPAFRPSLTSPSSSAQKGVWSCLQHSPVSLSRFEIINHNQLLKAIQFHTCCRGGALTLPVMPSSSVRWGYLIILHMSAWQSVCCHSVRHIWAKLSNSLSLLLYIWPGVMLSTTGDAFSQLERIKQRK